MSDTNEETVLVGNQAAKYHAILRELLRTPNGSYIHNNTYYASADLLDLKTPVLSKNDLEEFFATTDVDDTRKQDILDFCDEFAESPDKPVLYRDIIGAFRLKTNQTEKLLDFLEERDPNKPTLSRQQVKDFLEAEKLPEYYVNKLLAIFDEFTDLSKVPHLTGAQSKDFYNDMALARDSYGAYSQSALSHHGIVTPTIVELHSKTIYGSNSVVAMVEGKITRIGELKAEADAYYPRIAEASTAVRGHSEAVMAAGEAYKTAFAKFTPKQQEALNDDKPLSSFSTSRGLGILDTIFPSRVTTRAELAKNHAEYITAETNWNTVSGAENDAVAEHERLRNEQNELRIDASRLKSQLPKFARDKQSAEGVTKEETLEAATAKGEELAAAIRERFESADSPAAQLRGVTAIAFYANLREYLRVGDPKYFGGYSDEYGAAGQVFKEAVERTMGEHARLSKFGLDTYMSAHNYPDYLRAQVLEQFDAATGTNPEKEIFTNAPARKILKDIAEILKPVEDASSISYYCGNLATQKNLIVSQASINLITHGAKGEQRFDDEITGKINSVFSEAAANRETHRVEALTASAARA